MITLLAPSTALGLLLSAGSPACAEQIVAMTACELTRPVDRFYMKTSKRLMLEGSITVDGESFEIDLHDGSSGYSAQPRPKRRGMLTTFTSTRLAIDQNREGEIALWEHYDAENSLRLGDSMFTVLDIAEGGNTGSLKSQA